MAITDHLHLHPLQIEASSANGNATPPTREPTPLRLASKSLRPYVYALMAFKHGRKFQTKPSTHRSRRLSELTEKEGKFAASLSVSKAIYLI
jgi:hypothetical protein